MSTWAMRQRYKWIAEQIKSGNTIKEMRDYNRRCAEALAALFAQACRAQRTR